jgi:hypothetical protein
MDGFVCGFLKNTLMASFIIRDRTRVLPGGTRYSVTYSRVLHLKVKVMEIGGLVTGPLVTLLFLILRGYFLVVDISSEIWMW